MIESSGHINQLGYDEEGEIDSILDEAEKKIFSIARMSTKQRFVNMKTSLMDAWERFDKLHKSKGEMRGVPSGFPELDNLLAGFQKSDLIILAARPSIGKSALVWISPAMWLARAVFPLESSVWKCPLNL